MRLFLNEYGSYLGVEGLNFIARKGREKTPQRIPFYGVDEIGISSGGSVSTKALAWASIYGTKVFVMSPRSGRPLGVFLPLDHDMHVETRVKQYQAYTSKKGINIAKAILTGKITAQASLLEQYQVGFDSHSYLTQIKRVKAQPHEKARRTLFSIEGEYSQKYVPRFFKLFPTQLQTHVRESYGATAPLNNILNLGYEVLRWEVYKSILDAHLDPYLGYLHSIEHSKPSLVCDIQEPYRAWIDAFLVEYCQGLVGRELEAKYHQGKPRIFLKHPESSKLIAALNTHLSRRAGKQRTHKYGASSKLKTIIQEDTEQLAGYIRGKLTAWEPTIL